MTESKELQQLRRLLRAGFNVERVLARAGQSASEPDSGFEITTTTQGSQAQVRYRTNAASPTDSSAPVTVTFPDEAPVVEAAVTKGSVKRILRSTERDFWDFTINMHPSLDARGNRVLRRFRDTSRYIDESKWFATAHAARKGDQLAARKVDHLKAVHSTLFSSDTPMIACGNVGISRSVRDFQAAVEIGL